MRLPVFIEGDCKVCRGWGSIKKAIAAQFPAASFEVRDAVCVACEGTGKEKNGDSTDV
jgi:DnaJ-class molecular chaperone